ncbi:MAG: hypothetical protein KKD44_29150 [Proteobacteria bacterium]|nr:hypothetical protein [Pseudomonadota bacterium]
MARFDTGAIKRTKTGWLAKITNRRLGMLEQGGWCDRRLLIKDDVLRSLGIDPDGSPDDAWNDETTVGQWFLECVRMAEAGDDIPYQVVRRGVIIR